MTTILVVDDERPARVGLMRALKGQGYELIEASDGEAALQQLAEHQPQVMILDLNMPRMDGLSVLRQLKDQERRFAIIVMTAYGNENIAVEAMKSGAYDYLKKPYDVEELRVTVRRALETLDPQPGEDSSTESKLGRAGQSFGGMVGRSPSIREVFEKIERVSELDVSVLLAGESGTGKELVARAIHERSPRRDQPFVAVNCAALPENLIESDLFGHVKGAFTGAENDRKGKFELANGGTLLLDEIGDMSIEVQAKLLRTLEQRTIEPLGGSHPFQVDVRVIAATHKNLRSAMEKGLFREDLYYRLKVVEIALPRLSERLGDIPLLVNHFIGELGRKHRRPLIDFNDEAMEAIQCHDWRGNVRELKNFIEGVFVMAGDQRSLGVDDLPLARGRVNSKGLFELPANLYQMAFSDARKVVIQSFERDYLERHLKVHKGNISRTAQSLGMHRQSLQQKLKELGIQVNRFRSA